MVVKKKNLKAVFLSAVLSKHKPSLGQGQCYQQYCSPDLLSRRKEQKQDLMKSHAFAFIFFL